MTRDDKVLFLAARFNANPAKPEETNDAVLIALDACALFLAARIGNRAVAEELYRRADAYAVIRKGAPK